ncbi:MAG: hypothetical protein Q7U82_15240 [Gammaproteobacteria bacterium]|nr:hypothetical protein [Gammaproteobacteria bacterium]
MNKKITEIILSTFSSGVAIGVQPIIALNVTPEWMAVVLAALLGAATFYALSIIVSIPFQFHQLRRFINQTYGIEGYWFVIVDDDDEHPYSFTWIRYQPSVELFQYRGRNFYKDLTVHARWSSSAIITDGRMDRIHFLFEADLTKQGSTFRGHGAMDFSNYLGGVYTALSGSFVDSGPILKRRTFSGERVTGVFVKSILGKSSIADDEDTRKVVEALLRRKKLPFVDVQAKNGISAKQ